MFRICAVVLLLTTFTLAAELKQARVVDFQDASTIGGGTVTSPSSNGVPVAPTRRVGSSILEVAVTLELEGKTYIALFEQDSHFQMADLNRGSLIPVRIEGKKVLMQRPVDGKEIKGKIIRVDSSESSANSKTSAK